VTSSADYSSTYPWIRSALSVACGQGRTGEPFWQKESYDHWVRNPSELEKIRTYIENNPVKAGLVRNPQDYLWSSAGVETSLDAARKSACATLG